MTGIRTNFNLGTLAVVILFSLSLPDTSCCTETEWTHLFTRDGIDVYRKTLPGTPVCAFKGVGFVDAEMGVVGAVLQDISAYPQWVARCRESVVLKEIDCHTRIVYSVIDTPKPFKDRDMILSNTTIYNPERGVVEITFDIFNQGLIPPQDKYFRVSDFSGKYLIEPFSRNKTLVSFVFQGNPGGNIPVTIANWVESRNYPHTIIMGLREMVQKNKCIPSIPSDNLENRN
jgi:hypothetical protein